LHLLKVGADGEVGAGDADGIYGGFGGGGMMASEAKGEPAYGSADISGYGYDEKK
jgi:hypothetical protein